MIYGLLGLGFIFLASTLGASFILFNRKPFKEDVLSLLMGFSSGVMFAAALWSLLIPALETSPNILYVVLSFLVGSVIFVIIDIITKKNETQLDYSDKLFLAVTIHNIPEGLVVGLSFGVAMLTNNFTNAFAVALAIGIQNFPESIALSIPLKIKSNNKKSFVKSFLSGLVEPFVGLLGIFLAFKLGPFMPLFLGVSSGCMIYVIISEMLPESSKNNKLLSTIGFIIGFLLMMVFDIVL